MSTIPVARPVPRRLIRGASGVKLEVIRWQPIDRDVFAPVTSFVAGEEACLKQLGETVEEDSILRDAAAIMKGLEVGESFELVDGKWVREAHKSTHAPSRRDPSSLHRLEEDLAALRARVSELEQLLQARRSEHEVPSERFHDH